MSEQKDFGETRMFSPDAVKRFQKELNGETDAAPPKRRFTFRTFLLLLLFATSVGYLIWDYRAPLRQRLTQVFHPR